MADHKADLSAATIRIYENDLRVHRFILKGHGRKRRQIEAQERDTERIIAAIQLKIAKEHSMSARKPD